MSRDPLARHLADLAAARAALPALTARLAALEEEVAAFWRGQPLPPSATDAEHQAAARQISALMEARSAAFAAEHQAALRAIDIAEAVRATCRGRAEIATVLPLLDAAGLAWARERRTLLDLDLPAPNGGHAQRRVYEPAVAALSACLVRSAG